MKLLYNGTDIYGDVALRYCVHEMFAEKQADTLTLRFNDPKGTWSTWAPAGGDVIRLTEGAADTGEMFIHSMKPENGAFTIRAMAMPRSGATKRSRSWEGVRFLQLGQEIAAAHGLTFKNYGCKDQVYPYMKQENEKDFAFFSRLCTLEGCQMLIYDGNLLAYNEQHIEAQTPTRALTVGEGTVYAFRDNRAACYGACEVHGGVYSGRFDAPDNANPAILRPDKAIPVNGNAEAARFARGLLRNANKYGRTGQITANLLPGYAAASLLHITAENPSTWDGPAFLYKVRHDFVAKKSALYFRAPLEGY